MICSPRSGRAWLMALLLVSGCGGTENASGGDFELCGYRYDADRLHQWALPDGLQEISGLTLDDTGRLFAHDDESAIVYQLDTQAGRVVKRFQVGDPPLKQDFEGIAWANNRLHMITSDGMLFSFLDASDGAVTVPDRVDTGFGGLCEIEGLHAPGHGGTLLMACKRPRDSSLKGRLAVLAWSLDDHAANEARNLVLDLEDKMNPSGLTHCPQNGNLLLVAARQRVVLEIDADGELVTAIRLGGRKQHPQMEGVEMTAGGDLIVADEGGKGRGRLSVYTSR